MDRFEDQQVAAAPMLNGYSHTPSRSPSPPQLQYEEPQPFYENPQPHYEIQQQQHDDHQQQYEVEEALQQDLAVEEDPQPSRGSQNSRENSRLTGTVKWFNAKVGYGFITRHDTGEDIFVHFSGVARKNPRHAMKSLGDGEIVEFNIMATNVKAPGGGPVRGNPYVSYLPVRRNDSFASGDPPSYFRPRLDYGRSRIPRLNANWQHRQ